TPAIGLLNMGVEDGKGGETLVEAHRRLRNLPSLNFVGNVEGNDLVRGKADVIVCEGLLGNVALKLIEGVSEVLYDLTSSAAGRRGPPARVAPGAPHDVAWDGAAAGAHRLRALRRGADPRVRAAFHQVPRSLGGAGDRERRQGRGEGGAGSRARRDRRWARA